MQAYRNSQEHIFDELRRLELLLCIQVEQLRSEGVSSNISEFRGLFLSEEEVNTLLGIPDRANESTSSANIPQLQKAVKKLEKQIADKIGGAIKAAVPLSLLQLKQRFQLIPFDADVLLLCLAPELDLKFEKLYAYLQNDVTAKRPTIDLALRLHCPTLPQKVEARARFTNDAPLFKHQLVTCFNDEHDPSKSFLSWTLKIDEPLVKYLLDVPALDDLIAPFTRLVQPRAVLDEVLLDTDIKAGLVNRFTSFVSLIREGKSEGAKAFNFYGLPGSGKKYTAEAVCHLTGIHLLIANFPHLLASDRPSQTAIKRLFREAQLHGAAIYLDNADALSVGQEDTRSARRTLLEVMETFPGIVFFGSEKGWITASPSEADNVVNIYFPEADFKSRERIWGELLKNQGESSLSEEDITDIAGKFQFTPGKIFQAAAEANHYAAMRREGGLLKEDVNRACRAQSTTNLSSLAQKITPLFIWKDIILPHDCLNHMKEICLHIKHRQQVFSEWNFDQKISLGKGTSALFAGLPGTGKTMAAEVIANELALDLYKIDLSTVVSKYIGETEKNLSRIFQEAETSNAILFFDEADALFGKRSEVKDSHDRYANIEINYLLQKMEEYLGMVILATNFQKNIDEAFTRRLRFIVDFPFPDRRYRARIWSGIFPSEMPRSRDIAYDFLAKKFDISGGHIKNIALGAAFLAAENSGVVGMKHIIRAAKREFQKMGRMVVKSDFDEYFDLLESEQTPN